MVTPPPDVVNIGGPAFTVRATDLADAPGVVENCLADLRPPGRKLLSSVGRRPIIFQKISYRGRRQPSDRGQTLLTDSSASCTRRTPFGDAKPVGLSAMGDRRSNIASPLPGASRRSREGQPGATRSRSYLTTRAAPEGGLS